MKLTKEDKELLEKVFRKHIADMQAEQYQAEIHFKKKVLSYDSYIESVRNLYNKITGVNK